MLRSAGVSSKYRSMSLRVVCSLSMAVSRHTRTGGMSMGGMGGPGLSRVLIHNILAFNQTDAANGRCWRRNARNGWWRPRWNGYGSFGKFMHGGVLIFLRHCWADTIPANR